MDDPLQQALPDSDRSGIDDILQTLHQHAQHIATASIDEDVGKLGPTTDVSARETHQVNEERVLRQWTKDQLVQEVIRLRTCLRVLGRPVEVIRLPGLEARASSTRGPDVTTTPQLPPRSGGASNAEPEPLSSSAATPLASRSSSLSLSHGKGDAMPHDSKKRKRAYTMKSETTGKRLEAPRRTELTKALRAKMKGLMGAHGDGVLPHYPPVASSSFSVPNWDAGLDDANILWIERACTELLAEAALGAHPKIPPDDLALDILRNSAKTAFLNFAKRYHAENDATRAGRKARYAKNRRRWARKDLKQKRRATSAGEPDMADTPIPPSALHIDYMSSEYSSAGEDSEEGRDEADAQRKRQQRRSEWAVATAKAAETQSVDKKGWPEGLGPKVLEVRTPAWRPAKLNELYAKLDDAAARKVSIRAGSSSARQDAGAGEVDVAATQKAGHVAPSHHRFRMPADLARRGKAPSSLGDVAT